MSNLVDKKLGEVGEFKVDQDAGVLQVEADISQPISVGGVVLGAVEGKALLKIDEMALLEMLAAKYPVLQAGIKFIKEEMSALKPAA